MASCSLTVNNGPGFRITLYNGTSPSHQSHTDTHTFSKLSINEKTSTYSSLFWNEIAADFCVFQCTVYQRERKHRLVAHHLKNRGLNVRQSVNMSTRVTQCNAQLRYYTVPGIRWVKKATIFVSVDLSNVDTFLHCQNGDFFNKIFKLKAPVYPFPIWGKFNMRVPIQGVLVHSFTAIILHNHSITTEIWPILDGIFADRSGPNLAY